MIKKIGLTGGSGAGKGFVCESFSALGIPSVDTDALVHTLYEKSDECLDEIRGEFGDGVFENGKLSRKKLGAVVFADGKRLDALNGIVHKYVKEECERIASDLEKEGKRAVVFDAPQLYEAGMDQTVDFVIAVIASQKVRIERIRRRDGITVKAALARIRSQHDAKFFRDNADYVIKNNASTQDEIKKQLETILGKEGV